MFLVACGGDPPPKPATPAVVSEPARGDATFTGKITEINFGCALDARCHLLVDGTTRVHFGHGTRGEGPQEWGNSDEMFALMEEPKQGVGRRVEVFAAKQGHEYTLQGKAAYYIKVLP